MSEGERGIYYRRDIKRLGEFRFVFGSTLNTGDKGCYMEAFFNPMEYGDTSFIVGYAVNNVDEEIEKLEDNIDYFINGAATTCLCKLENNEDYDEIYENILRGYFKYSDEEIKNIERK